MTDAIVALDGFGQIDGDALPNPDPRRFERALSYSLSSFSPTLTAENELQGWSLLSWAGRYCYIGWAVIFDPGAGWLPKSIADVDNFIARNLR